MKKVILAIMLAATVAAGETNLVIRGPHRAQRRPESISPLQLARTRLTTTQHVDGSWGDPSNQVVETSIALLGFGDLAGRLRDQSNVLAGVRWLLKATGPMSEDQLAARIIGLAEARQMCGDDGLRIAIETQLAEDMTSLRGERRSPWIDLVAITDLPTNVVKAAILPSIRTVLADYPVSTNAEELSAINDVRVLILRTLTANWGPKESDAGYRPLANLWANQREDGSFPPSPECGEASTIGLMVRAYRPWTHVGYRYLYEEILQASRTSDGIRQPADGLTQPSR